MKLSKGFNQYGASMGRKSDNVLEGNVSLGRVALNEGYDSGGAYWGSGQPLFLAQDEDGNEAFLRADNYQAAEAIVREQHPDVAVTHRTPAADELSDFEQGFLSAAIWSSTDGDEAEPLERRLDEVLEGFDLNCEEDLIRAFAPESLEKLRADCAKFQADNAADLAQIDPSQAGHDFWLTRVGAGVGYADRGDGEVGDRLDAAARKFSHVDLTLGDDGKVYAS